MTPTSITVSIVAGFSGTYGTVNTQFIDQGIGTWQKDVNARGGVNGRQVIIKKVDHAESAAGGVAACKEVLSNGSYTAMIVEGQGDGNVAAADCLEKAGFMNFAFISSVPSTWTKTYTFAALAADQGISLASFVKNRMGDGAKKLGVIYLKQPLYVASEAAYIAEAKKEGLTMVDVEPVEPNQTSFQPQLLRLQQAGAENVAIIATIEAVGILRDAKSIAYAPHFTGLLWTFDFITQAARNTADNADGLRYTATIDSPAYADFEAKLKQQGATSAGDNESMIDYGIGLLLEKILVSAGPRPTLASLKAGTESIKGYDNGILPPITWAPGNTIGAHASFPAQCCRPDYAWKSFGPPQATF